MLTGWIISTLKIDIVRIKPSRNPGLVEDAKITEIIQKEFLVLLKKR